MEIDRAQNGEAEAEDQSMSRINRIAFAVEDTLFAAANALSGRLRPLRKSLNESASRYVAIARQRAAEGDSDAALVAYERALSRSPEDREILKDAGQFAYETRHYAEATKFFRQAMNLDYTDQRALKGLAFALHAEGNKDEAVYRYFRYLDMNRDDYDALLNLSALFLDTAEYEQAIEYSKRAASADPTKASPLHNIALSYFNLGKYSEAETYIRKALAIDRSADSLRLLGLLLESQDKSEEALECYLEACNVNPNFPQAFLDVARIQNRTDQLEQYLASAHRAVELLEGGSDREGLATAYWDLGWAYYRNDDFAQSAEASRKALEIEPDSAPPRFNLALALLFLGQPEEAKNEYKIAIKNSRASDLKADGIEDLKKALDAHPELTGAQECLILLENTYKALVNQRLGRAGAGNVS
jgi:tetratricopeptide (TPR) repeat protein